MRFLRALAAAGAFPLAAAAQPVAQPTAMSTPSHAPVALSGRTGGPVWPVLDVAGHACMAAGGCVLHDPDPVGAGRVAAQVALGTVGTLGGFVGGGLATRWVARRAGASDERASRLAYVGAWTGAALATPVAPMLLGSRGDVHGSYPAALAGTLVGGAASLAIVTAGRRGAFDCRWCGPVRVLAGVGAFVLPSVGATVAFNASRERH